MCGSPANDGGRHASEWDFKCQITSHPIVKIVLASVLFCFCKLEVSGFLGRTAEKTGITALRNALEGKELTGVNLVVSSTQFYECRQLRPACADEGVRHFRAQRRSGLENYFLYQ